MKSRLSPAARRLTVGAGLTESFATAVDHLRDRSGIRPSECTLKRACKADIRPAGRSPAGDFGLDGTHIILQGPDAPEAPGRVAHDGRPYTTDRGNDGNNRDDE